MVNCLLGSILGVSKYGIGKLETVRHRFNYIQDEMGQFKIKRKYAHKGRVSFLLEATNC